MRSRASPTVRKAFMVNLIEVQVRPHAGAHVRAPGGVVLPGRPRYRGRTDRRRDAAKLPAVLGRAVRGAGPAGGGGPILSELLPPAMVVTMTLRKKGRLTRAA